MAILKHNNNSISNVTSFALVPSGSPVLLATSTASASASISFTTGIDSTYDIYKFEFINATQLLMVLNFNLIKEIQEQILITIKLLHQLLFRQITKKMVAKQV
jgi:hypothetical protein